MQTFLRRAAPVICCLVVIGFCIGDAWAQGPSAGRETGRQAGNPGAYPALKPVVPYICKTQEEIAWDLMMYGLQNIQPLRARIKDYDDLLDTYRRALRVVRGQDQ